MRYFSQPAQVQDHPGILITDHKLNSRILEMKFWYRQEQKTMITKVKDRLVPFFEKGMKSWGNVFTDAFFI